ncbi:hypothetical protein SETIT_8G189400v2 [Setaria italica]|uniref:Uncharacterized protein n=2 Tax=Setaria TaxID=4554 RepID=A0A368S9A5_SETIT|nr:hypothetical protein SETIT_8G189400v2 [Setaria italica]TKW01728.1 hypothetical protein SEVIR_8G198200v2 [Setaria viridis]
MCPALCILLIMSSSALSTMVEDHTSCDPMDPCTYPKCDTECSEKSKKVKNLPFRPKCDTPKECCCIFYREQHPPLVTGDAGTVATAEDENGSLD